jgi:hypothetical protein
VSDRIVIDSHFQLDGFTGSLEAPAPSSTPIAISTATVAPATLRRIFRRRGIGPVE